MDTNRLSPDEIRQLAERMLQATGEGPWRPMSEEKPPEMTPVMVPSKTSLMLEWPVIWNGVMWFRAWPYEDGRWKWWTEEYFREWRPLRFADGSVPRRVDVNGREERDERSE